MYYVILYRYKNNSDNSMPERYCGITLTGSQRLFTLRNTS